MKKKKNWEEEEEEEEEEERERERESCWKMLRWYYFVFVINMSLVIDK